jgi:hypothetical protein
VPEFPESGGPEFTEPTGKEATMQLTDLAKEESHLLINAPLDRPITWAEYEKRTKEMDATRKKFRKELFDLCSQT